MRLSPVPPGVVRQWPRPVDYRFLREQPAAYRHVQFSEPAQAPRIEAVLMYFVTISIVIVGALNLAGLIGH